MEACSSIFGLCTGSPFPPLCFLSQALVSPPPMEFETREKVQESVEMSPVVAYGVGLAEKVPVHS